MKRILSFALLAAVFMAGPAFAADPVLGTWKLDVSKSKFSPGGELKAATRKYSESDGLYTLDQKLTRADGKEIANKVQYRDGKEQKNDSSAFVGSTVGKKIDANTWDFELKKEGKVVGQVHRVVSKDGKTLTVHNTGTQLSGVKGDETLVFDKQ